VYCLYFGFINKLGVKARFMGNSVTSARIRGGGEGFPLTTNRRPWDYNNSSCDILPFERG